MAKLRWYMDVDTLHTYRTLVQRLNDAMTEDDVLATQEARELILALPGRPNSTEGDTVVPTLVTESSKVIVGGPMANPTAIIH